MTRHVVIRKETATGLRDLSVEVDGVEVGHTVTALSVDIAIGRPPILTMQGDAVAELLDLEADVQVVTGQTPETTGEAVAAFVRTLDPEEVRKLALGNLRWGGSDITKATLDVVAALAAGGDGKIGPPHAGT